MSPSVTIHFAGQELLLDASGALYWPRERMLVVSDLHLEKSTYLAAHGSLIAPYDTLDTLDRLQQLIEKYAPRELLLLGDSFHDRNAWQRLDSTLRARIETMVTHVEHWRWIEGNHDQAMRGHPLQGFYPHHSAGGMLFTHEHDARATLPQVIGHYHPKVSLSVRGRRVRDRCFAHTNNLLILPAFGSYTGGLDMHHAVYRALAKGETFQLHLIYRNCVHSLKHAAV